jgi:hypothetical protein
VLRGPGRADVIGEHRLPGGDHGDVGDAAQVKRRAGGGQIHDVGTIGWLVSHGLIKGSLAFDQIDYGAEFGNISQQTAATLRFTRYHNDLAGPRPGALIDSWR